MYKSPIQQQFELARKQALIKQGLLDEDGNQPTNPYLQELAQLNEKPSIFSHRNDDINAPAIDHAEPLWENVWFENECACIFGDPNIGKSTLAFQIACNVADSGRNVIYFDFENMMHQYHSRSWAPEQFIKPDNLLIDHFAQDTTFEQMTDRRLILDHIEQEFLKLNAPVIIIDDITQICPMRNNRKTHRVLRRLRQWLNQYHVSILVIAHASHHHEGSTTYQPAPQPMEPHIILNSSRHATHQSRSTTRQSRHSNSRTASTTRRASYSPRSIRTRDTTKKPYSSNSSSSGAGNSSTSSPCRKKPPRTSSCSCHSTPRPSSGSPSYTTPSPRDGPYAPSLHTAARPRPPSTDSSPHQNPLASLKTPPRNVAMRPASFTQSQPSPSRATTTPVLCPTKQLMINQLTII